MEKCNSTLSSPLTLVGEGLGERALEQRTTLQPERAKPPKMGLRRKSNLRTEVNKNKEGQVLTETG